MTRASGKRAAIGVILLAIALGFGGAIASLQPADARADGKRRGRRVERKR